MIEGKELQAQFDAMGLTEEERQRVLAIAHEWAERVRIAVEEAAEQFFKIIHAVWETLEPAANALAVYLSELEESGVFDNAEPRARRRKRERSRARAIEQRYRAEIRRCERERPYRQIYKPP